MSDTISVCPEHQHGSAGPCGWTAGLACATHALVVGWDAAEKARPPSLVPARLPASEPPSGEAAAIVARLRPDGAESASLAAAHADSLAALRAEVERLSDFARIAREYVAAMDAAWAARHQAPEVWGPLVEESVRHGKVFRAALRPPAEGPGR